MDLIFAGFVVFLILLLIVLACVIFTNAIEHLGDELNLSDGAVGSVLAAVGTALPETIVPLVAILGAYIAGTDIHAGTEIGIGAIMGAPFLLGTLAFFVTGFAVILFARQGKRSMDMPVNTTIMFRDLHYFAFAYSIAVFSSFIPSKSIKLAIAGLLVVIYAVYAVQTIRTPCDSSECGMGELEPLYLSKIFKTPKSLNLFMIIVQVLIALVGIIFLAHLFVNQIKFFAVTFNINPLILSLIITPIATELPEKFNSVIWIKAKKDTLAMGNITGAMVFQSCIPTAVGLALTPWVLGVEVWVNIIIVYLSVAVVYLSIVANKGVLKPSTLLCGGFFYLVFLVYIVMKVI